MKKSLSKICNNDTRFNSFDDYQLHVSLGFIKMVSILVGIFNILLLAADYMNYKADKVSISAIFIRLLFIISMILLLIFVKKIQIYKKLATILTIYELASILVFIYVFVSYKNPDFLIQSWGVFILIFFTFIVPNIWVNKVIVASLTAVAFLVSSILFLDGISSTQYIAGAIYFIVEIILCAIFTYYFKHYKRGEYTAKTELIRIYSTDPLTKIGNRNKLEFEAEKWLEFCKRHTLDLSLVLIDIDNLKKANDKHGHLVGDKILFDVSQIMKNELRTNDVCVRWGGDEFVLLLPDTSVDQARVLSERIRKRIIEHKVEDSKVNITCSFGITSMTNGQCLDDMISRADKSMYVAKSRGKNKVV